MFEVDTYTAQQYARYFIFKKPLTNKRKAAASNRVISLLKRQGDIANKPTVKYEVSDDQLYVYLWVFRGVTDKSVQHVLSHLPLSAGPTVYIPRKVNVLSSTNVNAIY